jgi:UDP-N-acetylglucosamine 2-epimerase (non-hydrolysing)
MLAAALTGVKLGLGVAHVEAGLRSYDWRMPEEHNRRMVDHVSDLLFAPTEKARKNLLNEQVQGEVFVTGNTVIDAVTQHLPLALRHRKEMEGVSFREYALATIHRSENVDSPKTLGSLVDVLVESPIPIVFPVHPRTSLRLQEFRLYDRLAVSRNVQLLPPVSYLDMLLLMKNCRFILTDSGGLQEEATVPSIRKYVLVARESTERPEAVETGFARVVGVNKDQIIGGIREFLDCPPSLPRCSPFGDGKSGERIADILLQRREMDKTRSISPVPKDVTQ